MPSYTLTFDIKSDWHIGSGEEGGAYADALVIKNHLGLPYLPGKSIKGLLRQAFQTAQDNQWFSDTQLDIETLFGRESDALFSQAALQISSAQLSAEESHYFTHNQHAKKHLFRTRHATSIDRLSGVAIEGSLRSMEVAVPMQLQAQLTLHDMQQGQQFERQLSDALTLITEFGGKRHRGLGQVTVSCHLKGKS